MEGLDTLNQSLVRIMPPCIKVIGGRAHFITSLPLIAFFKNMSLMNLSFDPVCIGGGFTTWMTRGGAEASLPAQQLDRRLAFSDSLWMAARVRLAVILSAEKTLCNLGTFPFVLLHLLSAGRSHFSAAAKFLRLI